MMRLTFYGGTETVTGSLHLLHVRDRILARDCGLYQGRREEARRVNSEPPVPPADVSDVILSHAHIDHCGNLPTWARLGFRGAIHATTATVALCDVMLRDAAHVQEQDAAYLNQKTNRRGLPPIQPLYTTADVERTMGFFRGYHYGQVLDFPNGVRVEFLEAGHILGAALTVFEVDLGGGRSRRIGFAFDLGRRHLPIIRDPEYMERIDDLVLESTYGGRNHADARSAADQLAEVVNRTLQRGGKVLIPSFALERAQQVIYHLSELVADGRIPEVPVYVDSPMATAITRIFHRSTHYFDREFAELSERIGRVMTPSFVRFTDSVEESKAITACPDSCIVIAASGMCEYGRILHHLKHGIENPRNTVVLVGYQAPHTLGRRLADGERRVRIFGDWFTRRAEVVPLDAFSAHAGHDELLEYAERVRPKRIWLVHGEPEAREVLAAALRERGFEEVYCPARGDYVELQ